MPLTLQSYVYAACLLRNVFVSCIAPISWGNDCETGSWKESTRKGKCSHPVGTHSTTWVGTQWTLCLVRVLYNMHFICKHLNYNLQFCAVTCFFHSYFETLFLVFILIFSHSQHFWLKNKEPWRHWREDNNKLKSRGKRLRYKKEGVYSLIRLRPVLSSCFQILQCGWQIQIFQIICFVIQEERQMREKFLREAQYSRGLYFVFAVYKVAYVLACNILTMFAIYITQPGASSLQ